MDRFLSGYGEVKASYASIFYQATRQTEAAAFTPRLAPADLVRAYGILGGTPLYLEQWNEKRSVRENLIELFGNPASMLVDSAHRLIARRELRGTDVGSWWSRDGNHEIDIVGTLRDRPSFIGSVKWRVRPIDRSVLKNLVTRGARWSGYENSQRAALARCFH